MTALDKLIKAVEAGNNEAPFWKLWKPEGEDGKLAYVANRAYKGSLDAALELHEALLPGWVATLTAGGAGAGVKYSHCTVQDWDEGTEVDANNQPTPARAWLLAILCAYRSIQE